MGLMAMECLPLLVQFLAKTSLRGVFLGLSRSTMAALLPSTKTLTRPIPGPVRMTTATERPLKRVLTLLRTAAVLTLPARVTLEMLDALAIEAEAGGRWARR